MRWPPVVIRGTSPRPTRTLPRATRTPPSADPKRRSKTTAPRGGGPSAPSNEAALGGGRIDEHPVGAGARAGVELVRALLARAEDVPHGHSARHQRVRDELPMASPGHGLRAHDHRPALLRLREHAEKARAKGRRRHVIGIPAESG